MKNIEEIWFRHPQLREAETIQLAYPANHTQNGWRAVGGKLFITTERLIFLPNVVDDKLGGEKFEVPLYSIKELFIKDQTLSFKELFSGGLVDRLGIRLSDGREELFVLKRLNESKAAIHASILKEKIGGIGKTEGNREGHP